jgi:hypothetical protein
MADQSAVVSGYGAIVYHPGNPEFPTLPSPGDPATLYLDEFGILGDTFFELPEYPIRPPDGSALPQTGAKGYADWYLNQVWATPVPIDFGDISDDKDYELTLYNTYRTTQSITAVDIPVDGIEVFGLTSPVLPIDLNSFGDEVVTFRASADGPNSFDDQITFTFGGGSFDIRTTGRRVLLLFAPPENGAQEQLEFATNIMRSKDGTEQAFSLRLAPRSICRYQVFLSDANDELRTRLRTVIMGGAPNLAVGVQLWWEARKITSAAASSDTVINVDTSLMQIANGDNIVFTTPSTDNVLAEVSSFTASTITLTQEVGSVLPLDTYCMPVRFGRLLEGASFQTSRINHEDIRFQVITESDADIANLDTNYFDQSTQESPGYPILKERCMRGSRMTGTIDREQQVIDSVTGVMYVTGSEPIGEETYQMAKWLNSTAEIFAWREFLHYIRGSWGKFYMPSFQNDLPLAQDLSLGGNTFVIPEMGIAGLFAVSGVPKTPKRDVMIDTEDGSRYYRRITNVVDNGNGTETITVDSVIGGGSPASSSIASTRISWMNLVRLQGDSVRLNHTYLGQAEIAFSVRTVKE